MIPIGATVDSAVKNYQPFSGKPPTLIKTGISPVDEAIGGLNPGECGILAAATGVGKSSIMLDAVLTTGGVIISCEDSPYVIGGRILSHFSGVDSLKLRRGDLTAEDKVRLKAARKEVQAVTNAFLIPMVGASIYEIEEAIKKVPEGSMVYLDYLQVIECQGHDRRNEISSINRRFRSALTRQNCAGIAISQLKRIMGTTVPSIHDLKESGDLENEARLIIMANRDKKDKRKLDVRIAKCNYGAEDTRFSYYRDPEGLLKLLTPEDKRARNKVELPGWK